MIDQKQVALTCAGGKSVLIDGKLNAASQIPDDVE